MRFNREVENDSAISRIMALRASTQRFPSLFRPRAFLGWGGALAVGLVALKYNYRPIGTGDFRSERTLRFRNLNTRTLSTLQIPFSWSSGLSSNKQMSLTPPQSPPLWNHSTEDISRLTKEFIAHNRAEEDKVGALAPKDCNFQSVIIYVILKRYTLIVTISRCL